MWPMAGSNGIRLDSPYDPKSDTHTGIGRPVLRPNRIRSKSRWDSLCVEVAEAATIPADQIKDIKPVMTMVGGRIVYDDGSTPAQAK